MLHHLVDGACLSSQVPLHKFLPVRSQIEPMARHEGVLSWASVSRAGHGIVAAAVAGLGFCHAIVGSLDSRSLQAR